LRIAAVLMSLASCAPGGSREAAYRPVSSSSPVTAFELAQCRPSATLLEAVEDLRPSFLGTSCRADGDRRITVMVDGIVMGGVETLQEFRVAAVRSVERLCGVDAMQRLGSRVSGSVILVTTGTPSPK
jgi:hypothetical protein